MKFKIQNKIIEKFSDLNIGVIVANNLNNTDNNSEIKSLLRKEEKNVREKIEPEEIIEIPSIAKWREVYKSFGAKPSKYRNSVEALVKRVMNGELPSINPLVDIYNYISIKYLMTVGGEDIKKIKGDLILDFAEGDEEFFSIGSDENKPPKADEVVYKDDKGIVCRRWNWREADRTKLTEETKEAIIVIENLIPENQNSFNEALNELKELVEKYCSADCEIKILNKDELEIDVK